MSEQQNILERLDKKVKEIILEPEEEIALLEEALDLIKEFALIRKSDGRIMLKEHSFSLPVKSRILIALILKYIAYRINELYRSIRGNIVYENIETPSIDFNELVKIIGTKKGTASGVLSNYLKEGIVTKEGRAKYSISNLEKALTILKNNLKRK